MTTFVASVGVLATFITAVASLVGVLVNNRKTSDVQGKVDGQLSAWVERYEAEHEARLKAEIELAVLKDRKERG